ncbi:hypothetical protein BH11BAC4_BH11BAC4_01360 [soil metagenome]
MINSIQYFVFFFESVAVFMSAFFFLQYSIIKRKEHLNYAIYLLCLAIYYILAVPEMFFQIVPANTSQVAAFNLFKRPVQFLSSVFYTSFIIYYLGLKTKSTFLYKFFRILIGLYLIVALACFLCNFFKIPYDNIYIIFSLLLFPLQVYVLIALFRHKVAYSRYIIWGSIIIVFTSAVTLVYSLYLFKYEPGNINANAQSYFPVQIGILLDMFLFTIALQKKIADNEKALINTAYTRQQAVLLERERIIADLHDDVGGGLSSIRMMSDLMVQKANLEQSDSFASFGQKISATSKDIAQRMHTIIWSLNAENDSLENFSEYVRQYGVSFFENAAITFKYNHAQLPHEKQLSGVLRKNLFLIIKEAFHNVIKHSGADTVTVNISLQENSLSIEILDNGNGTQGDYPVAIGSGNGLKNMRKRMAEIGGNIRFDPKNGMGIYIDIYLP